MSSIDSIKIGNTTYSLSATIPHINVGASTVGIGDDFQIGSITIGAKSQNVSTTLEIGTLRTAQTTSFNNFTSFRSDYEAKWNGASITLDTSIGGQGSILMTAKGSNKKTDSASYIAYTGGIDIGKNQVVIGVAGRQYEYGQPYKDAYKNNILLDDTGITIHADQNYYTRLEGKIRMDSPNTLYFKGALGLTSLQTLLDNVADSSKPKHYYAQTFNSKNYVGIGYKIGDDGQSSVSDIPLVERIQMNFQNQLLMQGKDVSIHCMDSNSDGSFNVYSDNTSITSTNSLEIISLGAPEPHLECALGSTTYSGSLSGYVRKVVDDYVNPQLTTLLS